MGSGPGNLIVISAPSGAGKTSLVQAVITRMEGISASVSHTTRARRGSEEDGKDYFFVDHETFRHLIDEGDFLEHAEVFGNLYGTSNAQIQRTLDNGTDLLLEIDWQGARSIRQVFPGTVSIFVLPPSEAALRQRLIGRGGDDPSVIEQRMRSARGEMSHFAEYEFLVINDEFDRALEELCMIIGACRLKTQARRPDLGSDLRDLMASTDTL
jgi:guanylate kinase